ncbi:MAG TPA: DUF5662 family protein [Lachnospiraceae bacterium]|nr:DUF5662 family protein [Lachnospiraceae bacterium]
MNAFKHFKIITKHKMLVMKGCFCLGLYRQGILHDLSKYSPSEFLTGIKYFQGTRSPNNGEREVLGYSGAWLHHKGRNKHHYEYWIDYSCKDGTCLVPVPMPTKYVVEMFVDRVAASKVYNKKTYSEKDPLNYYLWGKETAPMHEATKKQLEELLEMLADVGEKKTYEYIRKKILHN